MSKVAVIVPSHRPTYINRFLRRCKYLAPMDYSVTVIAQPPVVPPLVDSADKVIWQDPPKIPGLIEMVKWYHLGIEANRDADYFMFIDDDHRFQHARANKPSSGSYYQECINFMDENPKVGLFNTKSYFGGAAWRYQIKVNPTNGLININTGMFIRNVPEFFFTEEEQSFVGTLVESLIGYKMIGLGYDNAKRYFCPTQYERSKRLGSGGIAYDPKILDDNIQGYIRRTWNDPKWDHESRRYPKGLGRG